MSSAKNYEILTLRFPITQLLQVLDRHRTVFTYLLDDNYDSISVESRNSEEKTS